MALAAVSGYQSEIAEWRAQREARLKADGGWLTARRTFWLHEGANPFGKDRDNDIVLPDGPAHAGSLRTARRQGDRHADGQTQPSRPIPRTS